MSIGLSLGLQLGRVGPVTPIVLASVKNTDEALVNNTTEAQVYAR